MLRVRPATPSDVHTLRDVRLRALADAPNAFAEQLADAQARDDAGWAAQVAPRAGVQRLLAELGGQSVGMMVMVVTPEDQRRANLYAMWVAPDARRVGVGRALVHAGLAWARMQGALDVQLRVSVTQPEARALYRRCGFSPTGAVGSLREGSAVMAETLAVRLPPVVMGVVNVTPDSFSDGGAYLDPQRAIEHGRQLAEQGADLLDVGGEATNPRAIPVSAQEEMRRVLPVVEELARGGYRVSIDTTKAEVARAAVESGAGIVNDVSGGLFDPAILDVIGERPDVIYIAGHLRGRTLADVFAAEAPASWREVADELMARIRALPETARVWGDPGIGFGKGADPEGNAALIRHAGDIASALRRPLVVGPSRKRFLRKLLGRPDADEATLDAASVLASLAAVRAGAHVVRVHNVALLRMHLTAYNK